MSKEEPIDDPKLTDEFWEKSFENHHIKHYVNECKFCKKKAPRIDLYKRLGLCESCNAKIWDTF